MDRSDHNSRGTDWSAWLSVPGWAAYLACSWTWCIGMYLPVLLVRDFGIGGFVVFAVPNVLGAAGMGWVLRRPGATERVLVRNMAACYWFSKITQAFQFFFLGWMLTRFGWPGNSVGAVIFVIMAGAMEKGLPRVVQAVSFIVLVVSLLAFQTLWRAGELDFRTPPSPDDSGLLWLAPVCIFGFALCPYLDMTFHRARRMLPGPPGTAAFTLGFGVFFLAMILFTLGYRRLIENPEPQMLGPLVITPLIMLAVHLFTQLSFTVGVHSLETSALGEAAAERRGRPIALHKRLLGIALFSAGPLLIGGLGTWGPTFRGLALNEVMYRGFMAFYGLVFPTYVWLCMIPTRDGHSGLNRAKLRIVAAAVGIAMPMFWMGFIERQTWWLGPGLAVVLAARLFLPRGKAAARSFT